MRMMAAAWKAMPMRWGVLRPYVRSLRLTKMPPTFSLDLTKCKRQIARTIKKFDTL